MESINILLIIMVSFSGIITLLLGYKIRQNQSVESISLPNLSIDRIKDKAAFSRFAGNRAMMGGCSALITATIIGVLPQFTMLTIIVFTLLITVISLEFVISSKQYLLRD
jgi:uncharacterized membrane protein